MSRQILAVMAGLLVFLAGLMRDRQVAFALEEAMEWKKAMENMQLLLHEKSLPLPDLLEKAGQGTACLLPLGKMAAFLRLHPLQTPQCAFETVKTDLPKAVRGEMAACFAQLGTGSRPSREKAVTGAISQLDIFCKRETEKTQKAGRLHTKIGALCGAGVAILLW